MSLKTIFATIAVILIVGSALSFGAYKVYAFFFLPDYAWNQKITLVVDTPDGIKTGSAITRVEWKQNHFFKDGGNWWRKVYGEATYVDLGGGRYLFATIGESSTSTMAIRTLQPGYPRRWSFEDFYEEFTSLKKPLVIPEDKYPLLVTFGNINEPESVMQITSNTIRDIIGENISIKTIIVEETIESETYDNLPKSMNWIKKFYNKRLDGQRFGNLNSENKFANSISSGAFRNRKPK